MAVSFVRCVWKGASIKEESDWIGGSRAGEGGESSRRAIFSI